LPCTLVNLLLILIQKKERFWPLAIIPLALVAIKLIFIVARLWGQFIGASGQGNGFSGENERYGVFVLE